MKRTLTDSHLYAIIDLGYVRDKNAPGVLKRLINGGVDLVQLRGKNRSLDELSALAEKLLRITSPAKVPLIVNDYAEIAQRVAVQGVHVGQDDDSVAKARAKVKRPIIIGKSTHTIEQAEAAEREGADYIGFGPIFSTPTKPEYQPIGLAHIGEAHQKIAIPIFCIGGIKLKNLEEVIEAGAKRVVMVSGLLHAPDLAGTTRRAKELLDSRQEIEHQKSEIQ